MKRALLIGINEYQTLSEGLSSEATANLHLPSTPPSLNTSSGDAAAQTLTVDINKQVSSVGPTSTECSSAAKNVPPLKHSWPRLMGPFNDVDNFESLFRDIGFEDITILKNEQATKAKILQELERIVICTKVLFLEEIQILCYSSQ